MRKWVLPLILAFAMLLAVSVHAQASISLSSLQIGIWPEFDKPSVLVIYQMTLSTTTFPATVSIRIPATAGEPNAVASRQPDGSLINLDYTPELSGQWSIISFNTNTPDVQLEYYDPGLTKDGITRHFTYTYPGDYSVDQLTIQVQQPAGSTDMRISPSLGAGAIGSDNLTYYTQDIGSVSAGQKIQISIDYQKSSDALSAEGLPVQSSAPIPQGTSSDFNVKSWLPWVLGIIGAGLIVGGVIWFWQTGRQRPIAQVRHRRSRTGSHEPDIVPASGEDAVYCSQCGKRAMPGDQFCRSCGSPIRSR